MFWSRINTINMWTYVMRNSDSYKYMRTPSPRRYVNNGNLEDLN